MKQIFLSLAILISSMSLAPAGAVEPQSRRTDPAAEEALRLVRDRLAVDNPALRDVDLRIDQVREGLSGTHYRYGQWIGDRRVYGAQVVLTVDEDGHVRTPHVSVATAPPPPSESSTLSQNLRIDDPAIESVNMISRTPGYRNVEGAARFVERVLVEDAPFRLSVWEVDPKTGEVLSKVPLYFSATGNVFPANPVTTLNDAGLRDQGDSAAAVPSGSYSRVELLGLGTQGELVGPRVRVIDIDSPFTARAMLELDLLGERDRPEFEEVNVYHHLDQAQLYLQSLGYTGSRQIIPGGVRVDAHANRGADNSYFTATAAGPTLLFGDGGVDDAEDPDIILHEYGHAIHDWLSPGVLFGSSGSEGRAISEGFGDYWAFSSGLQSSISSGRDPYCIGDWDARCDGPGCAYPPAADCLRRVDEALTLADFDPSSASGTEHRNGQIWSGYLKDVFEQIVQSHGVGEGRRITDVLVLEGLLGLPSQPRFSDVIERMIIADEQLNSSMNRTTLCTSAKARGFNIPDSCEPQMRGEILVLHGHDPVSIPAGGGEIERQVTLRSDSIIERVLVDVELEPDAPDDLEIALVSPDGETIRLKQRGRALPPSIRFGRDTIPAEPLSRFEGRQNRGTWTLRFTTLSSPVSLSSWKIVFDLDDGETLQSRGIAEDARTIAAVASTPGAAETYFVSDVAIANTAGAAELLFIFTPSGENGTSQFSAVRVDAPAGESFVIEDVVRTLFVAEGTGALEIRGPASVRVSSRTYNRAAEGTFGQGIPVVDRVAGPGERLFLTQLRRNLDFRTNVGLVETSGRGSKVLITLRDRRGVAAGSVTVTLLPFTHRQLSVASFATLSEIDEGWIEVEVTGTDGSVAAYASVVDNRTGDSVFVPAERASNLPRPLIIPAVAKIAGSKSTNWSTDLWLANPSETAETVLLHLFGSGGSSSAHEITVEAGSSLLLPDVVGHTFATSGEGWILVEASSLLVSSRTWNDTPSGTYGQFIGALTDNDAIGPGDTAVIPSVVLNGTFRTNVGVTETSGGDVVLRVDVLDGYGSLRCSRVLPIGPLQHWQNSVSSLGCGTIDGGRIEISHLEGDGRIVGYGSIIDQTTGDPTYIRAE